ncbi:hypothetical protein A2Z67_02935 [Candidatus Woesebacteria bacterium RBG_13_36_22]|uniref:DUF5667 domain-containing protein n=1 Tax=Candidatus Woesebacteria bacterium RBG_13_36_22 TaxID=1802478 RepID=A0A1F7X5P4_9BACT|nr:MAG: hypothetical protein A2Z67_02935 [Candidatus Woesebacteria bacterium RBG_13_36_22]
MKKKIILPAVLALSVLVVGILATNVYAQEISDYPAIVQKIADEFNLNISDVQQVSDEERDEKRAEAFARFADRLDDSVTDGKLTNAQKDAILDKHEEMQDKTEEVKDLSKEDRCENMQKLYEEFKSWFEEQGIDESILEGFGGGFAGRGFGRGFSGGYAIGNGR